MPARSTIACAVLLASCASSTPRAKVEPTPVPTSESAMPSAMTLAIVYGNAPSKPRLERPEIHHTFSVWIDHHFSPPEVDLIRAAMVAMSEMTGGDVGFQVGMRVQDDLRIIRDGNRPVNGGEYGGLAYVTVEVGLVRRVELVLNPGRFNQDTVAHELGHCLGFGHPDLPGSIMSNIAAGERRPADVDVEAWRWAAQQQPGMVKPGLVASAGAHYRAPSVIVD